MEWSSLDREKISSVKVFESGERRKRKEKD
jgi:hypothetical protein